MYFHTVVTGHQENENHEAKDDETIDVTDTSAGKSENNNRESSDSKTGRYIFSASV